MACGTVACDEAYLVEIAGPAGAACAEQIIGHEDPSWSATQWNTGGSGAYGLPQALPGSKMAAAGADWATDPDTQERWLVKVYAPEQYGSICAAAEVDLSTGSY